MICQNLDSKNEHWASQWEIKMIIDLKSKLPITMTEYRNKSDSKSSRSWWQRICYGAKEYFTALVSDGFLFNF